MVAFLGWNSNFEKKVRGAYSYIGFINNAHLENPASMAHGTY